MLANDSDYKRANMLVHQSARFHSTAMMVTNLDASLFPTLKIGDKQRRTLFFDRILCDVPCSGDGTLRKNMQIWNSWQPAIGNGIHPSVHMHNLSPSTYLYRELVGCSCGFFSVPCNCLRLMGESFIQHAPSIQLRMRPSSPQRSIRCQVGFTIPGALVP